MKRSVKPVISIDVIAQEAWEKEEKRRTKKIAHRMDKAGLGKDLPLLPQAPITPEQRKVTRDPLDILIEEKGGKTLAQMQVDDLLKDMQ